MTINKLEPGADTTLYVLTLIIVLLIKQVLVLKGERAELVILPLTVP